jgi:hypothetical protein
MVSPFEALRRHRENAEVAEMTHMTIDRITSQVGVDAVIMHMYKASMAVRLW